VRKYPERPVVGVGAVILDRDRVVLVKRAHPPLQGEWSLPGGVVELGETLPEAVVREALEETGLDVEVGALVEVVDRVLHDRDGRVEYHFVIADYSCRATGGRLAHASDAADARWVPLDELAAHRVTETAIAVIRKAVAIARR